MIATYVVIFLSVCALAALLYSIWNNITKHHHSAQISFVAMFFAVMIVGIFIVPMALELRKDPNEICISSLKRISHAIFLYTVDNDGHTPLGANWPTKTEHYTEGVYVEKDRPLCNESDKRLPYVMNDYATSIEPEILADRHEAIMLFESDLPPFSLVGTRDDIAYRHNGRANIVFFDSQVRALQPNGIPSLAIKFDESKRIPTVPGFVRPPPAHWYPEQRSRLMPR